jgi:hypothetical protein
MLTRRNFVAHASLLGLAAVPTGRAWAALFSPTNSVDRDLDALSGDGREVTLARASVQELAASLRGNLLLPGVPAYERARRVLNAQIDRHPALIVQPRANPPARAACSSTCRCCAARASSRAPAARAWPAEVCSAIWTRRRWRMAWSPRLAPSRTPASAV